MSIFSFSLVRCSFQFSCDLFQERQIQQSHKLYLIASVKKRRWKYIFSFSRFQSLQIFAHSVHFSVVPSNKNKRGFGRSLAKNLWQNIGESFDAADWSFVESQSCANRQIYSLQKRFGRRARRKCYNVWWGLSEQQKKKMKKKKKRGCSGRWVIATNSCPLYTRPLHTVNDNLYTYRI